MIRRFFAMSVILTGLMLGIQNSIAIQPPSPSITFDTSPSLGLHPNSTYTDVKEVTYDASTGTEMIIRTTWSPNDPGPEVLIGSYAIVTGFGSWKASVTGTHKGQSLSASSLWASFGSTGTFLGLFPTWRIKHDLAIGSLVVFPIDKSLTTVSKALSGSGSIDVKQRIWDESANYPLPGGQLG